MRSMRLLGVALLAGSLAGCVYYNGVYNARRLTESAEKAERDGRPFEASGLWGQVVVKADSVVARHPNSKWVEDALVYRGQALAYLGQCPEALKALRRVTPTLVEAEQADRADLAFGRCELALGNAAIALPALAHVTESRDRYRRREAKLLYARALRLVGRSDEALAALADLGDGGRYERLMVLGGAGPTDAALALADSLVARRDSAAPWDSVLAVLGRRDPMGASTLVDRLRAGQIAGTREGRWLAEDAERLAAADPARARERLDAAAGKPAEGSAAWRARLALLRHFLRTAPDVPALAAIDDSLAADTTSNAAPDEGIARLRRALMTVRTADSVRPETPQGDLRLFLAAETAQDVLANPPVALALLRRVVAEWPESPYAAKALLAAMTLDPAGGDTLRATLESRYAASPYLAALRGDEADGYRALEDSLGAFAATLTAVERASARRAATAEEAESDSLASAERREVRNRGRVRRSAPRRVEAQP